MIPKKGQIVTCPNGHEICEIIADPSERMESSILGNFRIGQTKPAFFSLLNESRCEICGAAWARDIPHCGIHLENGWSDEMEEERL